MDECQRYRQKIQNPRYYGEQDENGVDVSLIRENLKLTPRPLDLLVGSTDRGL